MSTFVPGCLLPSAVLSPCYGEIIIANIFETGLGFSGGEVKLHKVDFDLFLKFSQLVTI
jgi:hypothetical protein